MAHLLQHNGTLNLTRDRPGLRQLVLTLDWDAAAGSVFDLDACALLLRADGRVREDSDLVFYNNLNSDDGAVELSAGRAQGAAATGPQAALAIDLGHLAPDIARVLLAVTVHEAAARQQDLRELARLTLHGSLAGSGDALLRYEVCAAGPAATTLLVGELQRSGSDWMFHALGQAVPGTLSELAQQHGVDA